MSKKKSLRNLDMESYQLTGVRAFFEESKALSQIRSISALWQEQTEGVRAALSAINSANAFNQQLSGITSALSSYQAAMDSLRFPTEGIRTMLSSYQNSVAAIGYPSIDAHSAVSAIQSHIDIFQNSVGKIHSIYSPITEYSKHLDGVFNKSFASLLKTQSSITDVISGMDLSSFSILSEALPNNIFEQDWFENLPVNDISEIYENEDFAEDVAEELREIIEKKNFSVDKNWSAEKKTKWYTALRYLCVIIMFLASPVVDYTKDKALDTFGITEFWNETGIYEYIDAFFDSFNKETVTEEEAKETVDTTKTGNISKQKREDLLAKIKEIRTFISAAPQDENTGNLLSYLSELEKDVNGKKYGLVFEEHREEIDEVLDTHTPVLTEDEELFIDNGGQMNFLIEGDNLASLKLLEKTHKGKIDLIYIDPPYNTGGTDFKYNDTIIAKEDTFRHSKWISFMKQRLSIAQKLLSENGIIFISIDENEQAALKLLCDEVFSPENHIETIIWKNKYGAGAKTVGFISVHEYILCYSKKPISDLTSELDKDGQAAYKKADEKYDTRGGYLTQPLMTTSLADRPNLMYDIEYNGDIIHPRKQWVWSKERLELAIQNNEVEFNKQKDGTYSVRAKKYLYDENGNIRRGKPISILNGPFTQDGTQEIRTFFGSEDAFKFSKPSELIKYFVAFEINGLSSKNAIVLDFFAGSGTTAQAVLTQNQKDKGNRKFILCTNNENNICRDVTYERIKRVIDKEGYEASLKYYKVEYIPVSERMYYEYADELLHHIKELVELENSVNFTNNTEIVIVLTEEELDEFVANIEDFSKCKKLYMGHDLLPTEEQEQAIASHEIEVNIIPDYYYRDLQEG